MILKTDCIIKIPTLNDSKHDFSQLFLIYNKIMETKDKVIYDFSECQFLRPNALAFIGGMTRLIESHGRIVEFDWKTLTNGAITMNLCQNGFANTFNHPEPGWDGHSIPYREDKTLDINEIMDYLTDKWIGKDWVHVSNKLRDAIAGTMWEIYNNAFEHSKTPIGVYSCGHHYKSQNILLLSIVDFGCGIPTKIKQFFTQFVAGKDVSKLSDANCIQWAVGKGHTTSTDDGVARGLGLDLLKEFVKLNNGKLELYSNKGYALINNQGEKYEPTNLGFEGTIVHITLRCDELFYHFKNES